MQQYISDLLFKPEDNDALTKELNIIDDSPLLLPEIIRLRIYSYLSVNELINIILNLSNKESTYISDHSAFDCFKWTKRTRKVVMHINSSFDTL